MARLLDAELSPEVRAAVPVFTGVRTVANTLYRFTPPFLTTIARSLGVSLDSMGVAIGVGELAALATLPLGRVVDRTSRRRAMVLALAVLGAAATLAASSPNLIVFALALVLIGEAKPAFDVGMGAWIGDRVDYVRRGRVVGLTETSWAGALLLGVPVLALVTALTSWRIAFVALAVGCAGSAVLVHRRLPPDAPPGRSAHHRGRLRGLGPTLPAYLAVALLATGAQFVFVVYGSWLEDAYGFSVAGIGGVSFLIGAVELCGSGGSMRFTDALGKRRSVALGGALMVPAGVGLAMVDPPVALGVALLALFFVAFEFGIVSAVPILSELHPEARATSIAIGVAFMTCGRAAAAPLTTRLYSTYGMGGPALAAALCGAAGALLVLRARVVQRSP